MTAPSTASSVARASAGSSERRCLTTSGAPPVYEELSKIESPRRTTCAAWLVTRCAPFVQKRSRTEACERAAAGFVAKLTGSSEQTERVSWGLTSISLTLTGCSRTSNCRTIGWRVCTNVVLGGHLFSTVRDMSPRHSGNVSVKFGTGDGQYPADMTTLGCVDPVGGSRGSSKPSPTGSGRHLAAAARGVERRRSRALFRLPTGHRVRRRVRESDLAGCATVVQGSGASTGWPAIP